MAARPSRKPRMAKHRDATFRPVEQRVYIGDDTWQRQADAAAWSAVSGLPPDRFLGWLEPIPTPPELRAALREAGAAYQAMPSRERLDRLMALAHEAAYGVPAPEPQPEPPRKPADGAEADWWDDLPAGPQTPPAALVEATIQSHDPPIQAPDPPIHAPVSKEWWDE